MKTYKHLYEKLIAIENLEEAYWKARRGKVSKSYIQKFDKHYRLHLAILYRELKDKTYQPKPLKSFILRDPKTRKICVSDFRDRIVHHALINILQPIFESRFIHDSYASRKNKGTSTALQRFDYFKNKINSKYSLGYVFKADIKRYFDTVDHNVLMTIINQKIKDDDLLSLVQKILNNFENKIPGKGMPLGNWTSQFFANIYLNELDQFIKHKLKAKYYIRYVDDFVILHKSKKTLQNYQQLIKEFLRELKLQFHPNKCKIVPLKRGVSFIGCKIFQHHKLLIKRNIKKITTKPHELLNFYEQSIISQEDLFNVYNGWNGYAQQANTYTLRQNMKKYLKMELEKRTNTRKSIIQEMASIQIEEMKETANMMPSPINLENSW
ncbi:hypothetical protein J4457_03905 [Candidatus Woesearchaeota archaeon]|nr:hypothetical protein [Candidatus Woesearchaeota archaeon]